MKLTPIKTAHGTAVKIELTGNEVATAIDAWLVARRVTVLGPRTITVNDSLCEHGEIFVDPSGKVLRRGQVVGLLSS